MNPLDYAQKLIEKTQDELDELYEKLREGHRVRTAILKLEQKIIKLEIIKTAIITRRERDN